jgi:hypothetical protein
MSRFRMLALVCACGLALVIAPAVGEERKAADPKPAPQPKDADPLESLLAALENEVQLREGTNINEVPLFELLQDLSKRYQVTFIVNEESFKADGIPNIREEKAKIAATQLRGLRLSQFLLVVLDSMSGTYLIKNNAIEIVPVQHAARATKTDFTQGEEGGPPRLKEPLVSMIVKDRPLNEAVARIAEAHDLTVILSLQAGEAKNRRISARILNTPADQALEVLTLQCDLRILRRGATFFVTSRDHANELSAEKLEQERVQIELKKSRADARPKPPAPPAAPEKK